MTPAPNPASWSMRDALDRLGRRLVAAVRSYLALPDDDGWDDPPRTEVSGQVERPWRFRWDLVPKRSAGPGFGQQDYEEARRRAEEVARLTLGDALWEHAQRRGYLELSSAVLPGITYRLRIGRRIEVRCAPGVTSPWPHPFLCINPAYPLPEAEFFAQLYLYVRDNEDEIIRVAAPQPWDQALGRTF
jgi:hypothetical protein